MIVSQKTKDADCPQSSVLHDYVLGRLHPPELDECEAHVAECDLCHETLRTLDTSDTLSEKVAEVISGSSDQEDPAHTADESQHRIGRLIGRLTSREFVLANGGHNLSRHGMTPAESELLADRAAEVLRYVKEETSDAEGALGRLGDYRLLHLIGAGSTGVVFQAQDLSLDRLVALKVLRPSLGELARQRFLAEARSAASIEHANVVAIYQVGQVDRLAFMAMQWQPGQTLESKLRSGDRFDNDATSQIIKQIAAGLEAAHQNQVVHRDIKPANIWLCENDDEVKILDFGLARIPDDDPGLTATGMLAGTPNFMSPEQSRGLELDGRSDLFSLGCVMYQLLTSRLPFGAPTVLATLQSIQNDSPLVPQSIEPSITDELSDLTMSLLEKQPANRPQTAAQLIDMLGEDRASWPLHVNRYATSHLETRELYANRTQPAKAGNATWSSRMWQTVALLLIGTAAWWWSPQIIRIATDQGEVVIETGDEAVEIQIFKDEKLIRVVDTKTQQAFDLRSGNYTIKANGDDSARGTFEVTPNSLVMKRGEQQIVRVSHTPKVVDDQTSKSAGQGRAGANDNVPKVRAATSDQKLAAKLSKREAIDIEKRDNDAQDEQFNIYFERTKTEYDQSRIDAVEICTKLMRTDEQRSQMIELIRPLFRTSPDYSRTGRKKRRANLKVLYKLPLQKTLEFIEHEIAHGNRSSLIRCADWVEGEGLQDRELDTHFKTIKKCLPALCSMIADHYDNADVMSILNSLAGPRGSEQAEINKAIVDEIVKQGVPELLKLKVLTGKPDFHISASPAIHVLLGDDREVYQKIESDLFATSTTPTQRRSIFYGFVLPRSEPKTFIAERRQTALRFLKHDLESLTYENGYLPSQHLKNLKSDWSNRMLIKEISDALDEIRRSNRRLASNASGRGRAVTNDTAPTDRPPTEPVYQGKTFSQWLATARHDRDDRTRITAISACTATAETDQQWDRLLALARKIARQHGTRFVGSTNFGNFAGSNNIGDAYMDAIGHAMHKAPPTKAFDFVYNEIKDGNKKSRNFCSAWVNGLWLDFGNGSVSMPDTFQHLQKLAKAAPTLSGFVSEHLEEPAVIEILKAMLQSYRWMGERGTKIEGVLVDDCYDTRQSIVDEVVAHGIPAVLKQKLLTGTTDFRVDTMPAINVLLPKDADVLAAFESDFLKTKTTPRQRLQILMEIDPTPQAFQPVRPLTLLEEKCQTVMRLLKSDLANLPVAIPANGTYGATGTVRTVEMSRDWLVQILSGLQAKLEGQGGAELMTEITAVLAKTPKPTETQPAKTGFFSNVPSPNGNSKVKPLKYDGRTFDQWYDIAAYDHLEKTYSDALRGCAEIATKEERAKMMTLFRQIARNRVKVRHVNSRNESMKTMRDILNEIPAKEAVDFVIEEVAVGTKSSRQLCTFWIANSKHKKELLGRTEELLSTIVASLDPPGVEDCMEELIKLVAPDKTERPKKKKEMSTTQKQFHEAILGGSSEFRTRYCYPAISWLGYQQDLFAKYADDILNSDTDPLARLKIFNAISTSGAGPVDDRAKLFQKIANDVLAGDKRQLQQVHPRSDKHDAWLVQTALLNIYRSAGDTSEETRKQFLIPQIENMAALVRSSTEKSDNPRKKLMGKSISVGKMRIHLADLEFLVEHLRGNADAKMPRLSIFKGAN